MHFGFQSHIEREFIFVVVVDHHLYISQLILSVLNRIIIKLKALQTIENIIRLLGFSLHKYK